VGALAAVISAVGQQMKQHHYNLLALIQVEQIYYVLQDLIKRLFIVLMRKYTFIQHFSEYIYFQL